MYFINNKYKTISSVWFFPSCARLKQYSVKISKTSLYYYIRQRNPGHTLKGIISPTPTKMLPKKIDSKQNNQSFISRQKETSYCKKPNLKNVTPYVSTHNPQNPEIYNLIRNNLPFLEEDTDMKKIFDNSQIIKLVKDKGLIWKQFLQEHFYKIFKKNLLSRDATNLCSTCPYIAKGFDFQFKYGCKFTVYQFQFNLCYHLCRLRENIYLSDGRHFHVTGWPSIDNK